MHVYQGYKHQPYRHEGASDRQPSRKELERKWAETHASPHGGSKPPGSFIHKNGAVIVLLCGVGVAAISTICWIFGIDMVVPLLSMIALYNALLVFMVMN